MEAKYFCNCGSMTDQRGTKMDKGEIIGLVRRCRASGHMFVVNVATGKHSEWKAVKRVLSDDEKKSKAENKGQQSSKQRSENAILNCDRKKFGNQRIPVAMRVVARENNDPPKQIAPIPEEWAKQAEIRHKIEDRRIERELIGKDLW